VVKAGLRPLEARDALRAALIEGDASGGFEDFDADVFLASMQAPHRLEILPGSHVS
jgi:antitoxin ParD1/3/4